MLFANNLKYTGFRPPNHDPIVYAGNALLPLRLDLRNHSPCGFNWGYCGSGPAQLALAILAHASGDDDAAMKYYQDFKRKVIAALATDEWEMELKDVMGWMRQVDLDEKFLNRN